MPVGTQAQYSTLSPLHYKILFSNHFGKHVSFITAAWWEACCQAWWFAQNDGCFLPIRQIVRFQVFTLKIKHNRRRRDICLRTRWNQNISIPWTLNGNPTRFGSDIKSFLMNVLVLVSISKPLLRLSIEPRVGRRAVKLFIRGPINLCLVLFRWFLVGSSKNRPDYWYWFDGYAIGGLSVGEGHEIMCEVLNIQHPICRVNIPAIWWVLEGPSTLLRVMRVDMFDCVIQTRHSRSGMFYTSTGRLRMTDRRFRNDMYPPDTSRNCYCTRFGVFASSLSSGRNSGATLATIHNLTWLSTAAEMRQALLKSIEEYRAWA